jgi:hypothetical protein
MTMKRTLRLIVLDIRADSFIGNHRLDNYFLSISEKVFFVTTCATLMLFTWVALHD